ncbi:MAG TPA: hypothetical protein VIV40_29190 [Kofleriaceae bacterium]
MLAAASCGDVGNETATVTITLSGTGSGEFEVSQGTVDCSGTTCTAKVPLQIAVTIVPMPAAGSTFSGWSGGSCDEFLGGCELSVTGDLSLTASFVAKKVALRVARNGGGLTKITSTPAGINCGPDCVGLFDGGTMISLTQTPTMGTTFMGWSGPCSGGGECTFTITEDVTVTAMSQCDHGMQTFDFTGTVQTFTLPMCVSALTVDAFGAQGGHGVIPSPTVGGKGAEIKGTFAVSGGPVYNIIVGGLGASIDNGTGGGGGGSFVYLNDTANAPLIAAGGGGGGSSNGGGCVAGPGSATITPTNSTAGAANAPGGVNGGGGQGGAAGSVAGTGGGGAGWFNAGTSGASTSPGFGGQPPRAGAAGAPPGTGGVAGGYGGGGSSAGTSGSSGGGGGYNGGGGGNGWNGSAWGCGGGGGSFNNGSDQLNTAGVRDGNGQVIFTW